jgi:hypothetical protein
MRPSINFLLLSILVFQLIIEFVVYYNWKKFIVRNRWNIIYFYAPLTASVVLLCISVYINFAKLNKVNTNATLNYIVFYLNSILFLPKLPIFLYFIFKSIFKGFVFLFRKFNFIKSKEISVDIEKPIDENKRKILAVGSLALASAPFILVYKGLKTTYELEVKTVEIILPKLSKEYDGFSFVQISDLHLGSFPDSKFVDEIAFRINMLKPELVAFTGDWVNNSTDEFNSDFIKSLNKIQSTFGKIACLGNHDHYTKPDDLPQLIQSIELSGFKLLQNEVFALNLGNEKLNFLGVDNTGMRQNFAKFDKVFSEVSTNDTNILLCHDPTNWDKTIRKKMFPADLTLSGHTHGGQMLIANPLYDIAPAKWVYKQYAGLYQEKDMKLYVNVGLGTVGPPIRIGVNPEITNFILRTQDSLA